MDHRVTFSVYNSPDVLKGDWGVFISVISPTHPPDPVSSLGIRFMCPVELHSAIVMGQTCYWADQLGRL